jgi:glycosyltransferase involved in cell wall biosynthesis
VTLTVLSVSFALARVGPDAVGGSEQILAQLDRALVRAGHRSLVVAPEGSRVAGTLVATPAPPELLDDAAREMAYAHHRRAIAEALARWPVDLIHLHGLDFDAYLPPPGVPVLVTLHLPPAWYLPAALTSGRPDTWLHCVSEAQQRGCPPGMSLLPPIPNGVPVGALGAVRHARRNFALMLGRVCEEKGFHHGLDAAQLAGVPLIAAGEVAGYPEHQRYYREEVVPRLDAQRRFLGPLGFVRKRRLLSAARCLLVPSTAPETSSLVAMEALACGTPVVAFRSGALPEIVEHGRTGFLVEDAAGMADAIRSVHTIDPETCRRTARERFSADAMAARYLERYAEIVERARCVV